MVALDARYPPAKFGSEQPRTPDIFDAARGANGVLRGRALRSSRAVFPALPGGVVVDRAGPPVSPPRPPPSLNSDGFSKGPPLEK